MAKKLTTAEILAQARKQAAGESAGAESPPPATESADAGTQPEAASAAPAAAPKKPAAGGAKPTSTADILAAARAQKAAGAAAPAGDKPAAKATPKSTADILAAARGKAAAAVPAKGEGKGAKPAATGAAVASGEPLPSVEEMMKAVRGGSGGPAAEPAVKPKPTLPPLPKKPVVAAKKAPEAVSRRGVVMSLIGTPFAAAWTFLTATTATATLAMARFMFPNVLVEPPTRFKVGPPGDYPLGTVSNKWKSSRGIWIVHTDQYDGGNLIYALASVCTHLGCTPNWLDGEQKFKCPCHGSGFYITGINFEGPAPRPLERVGLRVAPDGMLEVDKSVKFQEEMGQWADPTSYVEIA
ncbi:MAG: ubiquinol-cytochrome c reductase iron-sulfur subunit [Planctomycetota bacterium]|nr:ubiquinol-cytochrome c reductase iron-sulfur subunit [Planctomycetota bacterium]MDA1211835.1 ubiquinol-cytochrome c reductase iron-sulfur subunit [Planctomycetota bacterium]